MTPLVSRACKICAVATLTAACAAPLVGATATTDCAHWLAEYQRSILAHRAAQHLRHIKYRLTHPQHSAPHHVQRITHSHALSALAALRKFQIDCGDWQLPTDSASVFTPLPQLPPDHTVVFVPDTPPNLGAPSLPTVIDQSSDTPVDTDYPDQPLPEPVALPVGGVPILGGSSVGTPTGVAPVTPVPESNSLTLTLGGLLLGGLVLLHRKRCSNQSA